MLSVIICLVLPSFSSFLVLATVQFELTVARVPLVCVGHMVLVEGDGKGHLFSSLLMCEIALCIVGMPSSNVISI